MSKKYKRCRKTVYRKLLDYIAALWRENRRLKSEVVTLSMVIASGVKAKPAVIDSAHQPIRSTQ